MVTEVIEEGNNIIIVFQVVMPTRKKHSELE